MVIIRDDVNAYTIYFACSSNDKKPDSTTTDDGTTETDESTSDGKDVAEGPDGGLSGDLEIQYFVGGYGDSLGGKKSLLISKQRIRI